MDNTMIEDRPDEKLKTVIVLVNPSSGRGKSLKHLEDIVKPILNSLNVSYKIYVTEHKLRVRDYLSEASLPNLNQFRLILVVSGDGLLHETVNTILARADWPEAIKIPLGIVPTGSGNGMAYTLIRQHHPCLKAGKEAIQLCCEQALKDDTCFSDLVKITYGKNATIWSFLSLGWGLLSDIDVDSDWLRRLGEFRFTIYGILRAFTAVSYRGRLSYKKVTKIPTTATTAAAAAATTTTTTTTTTTGEIQHCQKSNCDIREIASSIDEQSMKTTKNSDDTWTQIEDEFVCLYAVYQSHISSATRFAPNSKLTDQTIYLTYIRGRLSFFNTIKFLLAIEDGTHDKLPFVTVVPVEQFTFEPLEPSKVVVDGEITSWTYGDGPLKVGIVPRLMRLSWCP